MSRIGRLEKFGVSAGIGSTTVSDVPFLVERLDAIRLTGIAVPAKLISSDSAPAHRSVESGSVH